MHIIGHGRYAREAYPQSPAAGGGAAIVPLSRQKFIDGDTTQTGLNGSIASPFKTIAQFMASRGNVSAQDATAPYVGWLMPTLNGYTEDVFFPPYASTELRGECFSGENGAGTFITGNVTLNNVAGAFAGEDPAVVMHNISMTGTFTVTDDVGAPGSNVIFGGDEVMRGNVFMFGGFVSNTTTNFGSATFSNAAVASIDCGSAVNSASALLLSSQVGPVIARQVAAFETVFSGNITVNDTARFTNCTFQPGTAPVVTAPNGSFFDGPSWQSFTEANGSRDVATFALVVGGYSGGAVQGAFLTAAASPIDVTLNGTNASVGFTGAQSGNFYSAAGLLGAVVVNLKLGGGELLGDTLLISKPDLAAQTVTVQDSVGNVIGVIPSGERGFVLARFNGGDWVFLEGGSLAA